MLETLILMPIGVATWALCKKVLDQNNIIQSQEETIHTQQQILQYVREKEQHHRLMQAMAVVGISFSCWQYYRFRWGTRRRSTRHAGIPALATPPTNYQPTEAATEQEACVLCLQNQRDSVLQPCRHLATCWDCTQQMQHHSTLCPLCRTPVSGAEYVFVP